MDTNQHIGFEGEAPDTVIWSNTSFVKGLDQIERRKHGTCDFIIALVYLGLFFGSFILFAASGALSKRFPSLSTSFFILLSVIGLTSGFLVGILRNYFLKQLLIFKIRSRSELLFEPDHNCFYVGIENPSTYNKLKLHADDFGLLKITSSFIQIEMLRHRAQFQLTDLAISLLRVGQGFTSVQLMSVLTPHPWSIAVIVQSPPNTVISFSSTKTNSLRLYAILADAGVPQIP